MRFSKKNGIFEHNGYTYKMVNVTFNYFYYRYRGIANKSTEGNLQGFVLYNFGKKGQEIDLAYQSFQTNLYAYGVENLDYILSERRIPESQEQTHGIVWLNSDIGRVVPVGYIIVFSIVMFLPSMIIIVMTGQNNQH